MARAGRPLHFGRTRYANGNVKPIKPEPNPRVVAMRRHLLGAAEDEACDITAAEDVVALAEARTWITSSERFVGEAYGRLVGRVLTFPKIKTSGSGRSELEVELLGGGGSLSKTGVSTPDDYRLQYAISQFEAHKISLVELRRAERQHRRARFDRSGVTAEDLAILWDAIADDALNPKQTPPARTKRLLDMALGIQPDRSMDEQTLAAKKRLQEDVQQLQAIYKSLNPLEGRELAQMFVLGEAPNWMTCHIFEKPPNRQDKAAYKSLINALAKVAEVLCEKAEIGDIDSRPSSKIERRVSTLYAYDAQTGDLTRRIPVIVRASKNRFRG